MGLYMSARMSLFEVFCLVATVILLWGEFSQSTYYDTNRILLADHMALQDVQATQTINPFNHIRPPPLGNWANDLNFFRPETNRPKRVP